MFSLHRLKKILPLAAFAGFLAAGLPPGWALDKTDFQKLAKPVQESSFNAFNSVPLYYLELPPGIRFEDPVENRKRIRFFLDPQAAEIFRLEKVKTSRKEGLIKKISMSSILQAIYSQSTRPKSSLINEPDLSISAGEGSENVFFYFLTDTQTSKPYSLEFKKKKTIPAFVSKESAESLAKITMVSGSQILSLETYSLEKFLNFLVLQQTAGLPVRIFPYASRPKYTVLRPMTWGVGSSYLFGTFLVLFLFWAITRSAKKK